MEAFTSLTGIVVALDRANIDTDAIIPKQFLKSIKRSGFGPNLFDQWRYLDHGEPGMDNSNRPLNPEFVLNQQRYRHASILVARDNFGCGSSREHAPWALLDYGFRVIIAPSFADIFFNNCFKNGILPVVLDSVDVGKIIAAVKMQPGYKMSVNLDRERIELPDGTRLDFNVEAARKKSLLNGLDEIDETLQLREKIVVYETQRKLEKPWLFNQFKGA